MNIIFYKRFLIVSLVFASIFFASSVQGQEYKNMSDTARLNKKYGEISLEVAKLNTKLIAEKNKTVDYQSKTVSTAGDAVASGQASKNQADLATNGSTTDTKKAVRDAKEADRKANDSKNAIADEKLNTKKIKQLTAQIDQKQKLLRDLDSQRAAIMAGSVTATATNPLVDSTVVKSPMGDSTLPK
jgi:hypothetical protein